MTVIFEEGRAIRRACRVSRNVVGMHAGLHRRSGGRRATFGELHHEKYGEGRARRRLRSIDATIHATIGRGVAINGAIVVVGAPDRGMFAGFHDEVLGVRAMSAGVRAMIADLRDDIGPHRRVVRAFAATVVVERRMRARARPMTTPEPPMRVPVCSTIGRDRPMKAPEHPTIAVERPMIVRERAHEDTDHAVGGTVLATMGAFVTT